MAVTRHAMNIKQFCVTCAGLLLVFINNEYSYFSVRIIKDLDDQESTVVGYFMWSLFSHNYFHCQNETTKIRSANLLGSLLHSPLIQTFTP